MRLHFEKIFCHEVLDLFVAAHHQTKDRRLYASNGKYPLIPGITPKQCIGASHIDAVQPVGACTGQCRDAQRNKLTVGAQARDRPLHRLGVKIVNQAALDLLTLLRRQFEVIKHLINQQLPFSVRVTRVHDFRRFGEQPLDHINLFGHGRTRLQPPFFGHDRQIRQIPARIPAVVDIRLCLLQQVTDTPGHHLPVATFNIAVTFAMWLG